jgi:two-component system sensor histidine kinase RegB
MRRVPPWLLPAIPDEGRLWLTWLVRLRWLAVFAQAVTLAFVFHMLHGVQAIGTWMATMAILVVANLWATARLAQAEEVRAGSILGHLLLDVAALSTFFAIGGGPDNPFVPLYLVHVAMAAVMLPPRHAGVAIGAAVLGYSATFAWHLPLHYELHSLSQMSLQRLGQWLAFVITTLSVLVFVMGLATSLRRRKEQLLEARDRTARTDRLRSVGTLAAGAAHELNTPLSTLGLRLRRIRRRHTDPETSRDLTVMQEQVDRCSSIVQRLLVGAGNPMASDLERRALGTMVVEAVRLWSKGAPLEVELRDESEALMVELPGVAFLQGLINLLENAREAQETSAATSPLVVHVYRSGEHGIVDIEDAGCGLPQAADHVGEPFFTTKASGTGLGVFVARAVADGAGGGLHYLPREERGTVARWWFPEARRKSA